MEEFLIELLGEAADVVFEAVGALVAGAAIALVVYKVSEKITESNIAEHIRAAIQRNANKKIKEKLGKSILAKVKEKKGNIAEISISDFANGTPVMDLKIESDGGIDSSIKAGMKIEVTV